MNMSNYTQHLKSKKMYTLQLGTIYTNHNSFSPGGYIPHNMARTLIPRQPYSEAVPSTGGRLHTSLLRREGLGERWSLLWKEGRGDSKNSILLHTILKPHNHLSNIHLHECSITPATTLPLHPTTLF